MHSNIQIHFPENSLENCRLIVLDTETTGLNTNRNKLISIDAVEIVNGEMTGVQFHAFIHKRNYECSPLLYYLSDYNYKELEDNERKMMQNFLRFVGDSLIVTHNVEFDLRFINYELRRLSLPEISLNKCICTLRMAKYKKFCGLYQDLNQLRVCDLCRKYGVFVEKTDLHQGIVDAIVLARCVCKMIKEDLQKTSESYIKQHQFHDISPALYIQKNYIKRYEKMDNEEKMNLTMTRINLSRLLNKTMENISMAIDESRGDNGDLRPGKVGNKVEKAPILAG